MSRSAIASAQREVPAGTVRSGETRLVDSVSTMTQAISVRAREDLRRDEGARRPSLSVAAVRCTASWGRTARGRRPRSASCSASSEPTPVRPACSAVIPGATRCRCTGGSPTPGEVNLWPNLSEARRSTCSRAAAASIPRGATSLWSGSSSTRPRCGAYSKGNRQKVALVAAFASDVELLVLDEPTGLDPC